MPNICTNTVRIVGDKEKVQKLLDTCTTEAKLNYDSDTKVKALDLTLARPMPSVFEYIHKGSAKINEEPVTHWRLMDKKTGEIVEEAISSFGNKDHYMVKVQEEELDQLQADYGARDWYGWRVNNWGTKWITPVALDSMDKWEEEGWTDIDLTFETESAWGPPHELLDYISCEYDINVSNRWWEEGGHADWDHYTIED